MSLSFKTLFPFFFCFIFCFINVLNARTLEVGPGKTYANPVLAANQANPGDTILVFPFTYSGGHFISELKGTPENYIYLIGVDAASVIFSGSTEAFHFSDIEYFQIENISITRQTGNGMNIDDAGTFDTPSHHVRIINCHFYDINAQGNNDLLKLSGLDHFMIMGCTFKNGSAGGSGIDMVGCHQGQIKNCVFENQGSNSIQAKGGTQFIQIYGNWFSNGGQRTLNLGGSTGLPFFRPQNATFEAADISVFANVIKGSWAPIAFVGCVRVEVIHNTIFLPQNWVIRILQETVDPSRFLSCGQNSFINNIIYSSNSLSRHVNIGPNTLPETFNFSNNLWFNFENPAVSTPQLPVLETGQIVGNNPLFNDDLNDDFSLQKTSPAIDAGVETSVNFDFLGLPVPSGFRPDVGAYEYQQTVSSENTVFSPKTHIIFPSVFSETVLIENLTADLADVLIFDSNSQVITNFQMIGHSKKEVNHLSNLPSGSYFYTFNKEKGILIKQ